MMLLKCLLRIAVGLSALLAGCQGARYRVDCDYGIQIPPPDPAVTIIDFAYTPASPIRVGDTLRLTGRTTKPSYTAQLIATVGLDPQVNIPLSDRGVPPDAIEQDGVWVGELVWLEDFGTGSDLQVHLELDWMSGPVTDQMDGPPLTILPEEEKE